MKRGVAGECGDVRSHFGNICAELVMFNRKDPVAGIPRNRLGCARARQRDEVSG